MKHLWTEIETVRAWAEKEIAERKNWGYGDPEYFPFNDQIGVAFFAAKEGEYYARAYRLDENGEYDLETPYIVLI